MRYATLLIAVLLASIAADAATFPVGGVLSDPDDRQPTKSYELSGTVWYLYSDSELQQAGDTGGTVASTSPSNRYGAGAVRAGSTSLRRSDS